MWAERTAALPRSARPRERPAKESLLLTEELIAQFLLEKERRGCVSDTVSGYRRHLLQLYQELPEDKEIRPGTLENWQSMLVEKGYAARTVNNWLSAANSMMEFCGRRELQVPDLPLPADDVQPELTRTEYLRLLSAARVLGKERAYLLVKVFACTGMTVRHLSLLTVEAVEENRLVLPVNGLRRIVHIPAPLRQELRDYIRREGISSGPVFVTRNGRQYNRTAVNAVIQSLARDARVSPEKCNPRCLRKLYRSTQESIQASFALLMEQAHERLLETEQLTTGWEGVNKHEM